jgi:glucan phosphoethanolaminetransferase (alkaline phosphatase superfamily)
MMSVDFNAAINSKPINNPVYFQYTSTSTTVAPNAIVILSSQPIYVTSVNIVPLQNNLGAFTMTTPSTYSVVLMNQPGEWMECDYVPIDSEEVATYSLPITSGLVKSSSMFSSFQTIILFIVFFFICVMSYFIIPSAYLAVIDIWLGQTILDENEKKNKIKYLDYIITFIICVPSIILVICGIFVPTTNPQINSGDVVLSGFCMGIIYIIGYIVIQSKKLSGNFIDGVDYTEDG